jgi:putative FmdB family regulatory protein
MTKALKIGGVILIFGLAVGLYFWRTSQTASPTQWSDYDAYLQCRACGHRFKANLEVADIPPFTCPKCGKKEAWHLKQCRQSGEIFLPPLQGDPPRPPMIATCPNCGSTATGAAVLKNAKSSG